MDTAVHRSGARRVTVSHFPALLTLCLAVLVAQIGLCLELARAPVLSLQPWRTATVASTHSWI